MSHGSPGWELKSDECLRDREGLAWGIAIGIVGIARGSRPFRVPQRGLIGAEGSGRMAHGRTISHDTRFACEDPCHIVSQLPQSDPPNFFLALAVSGVVQIFGLVDFFHRGRAGLPRARA